MNTTLYSNYKQENNDEEQARHSEELADLLDRNFFIRDEMFGDPAAGKFGQLHAYCGQSMTLVHYEHKQGGLHFGEKDSIFLSNLFIVSGYSNEERIQIIKKINNFYKERGYIPVTVVDS